MRITHMKKPMLIPQDEWVTEALKDNEMVVEVLLRLKHAGTVESAANLPLLRWGSHQRRSRPSRLGLGVGVGVSVSVGGFVEKKEADSARASPMTPLCWSVGSGSGGYTSPSAATADGFEDTSRQSSCSTATGSGSKAVHVTNEITSCFKRSKKQKMFLDLKDAENLQLKERLYLEKKIARVQAKYEKRSAKNQSLKRMKHKYSDRIKNIQVSRSNLDESRKLVRNGFFYRTSEIRSSEEKGFFLPDLNMTPNEEEETLYGTS